MTSINQLLDSFGPPPEEVCRDWLDQIADVYDTSELLKQGSEPGCDAQGLAGHLTTCSTESGSDWRDWEISDCGELELPHQAGIQAAEAVRVLREWLNYPPTSQFTETALEDRVAGNQAHHMARNQASLSAQFDPPQISLKRNAKRQRVSNPQCLQQLKSIRPSLAISVAVFCVGLVVIAIMVRSRGPSEKGSSTDAASSAGGLGNSLAMAETQVELAADAMAAEAEPEAFEELTNSSALFGADGEWTTTMPTANPLQTQLPVGLDAVIRDGAIPAALAPSGDREAANASEDANVNSQGSVANELIQASPETLERMDPQSIDAGLAAVIATAEQQSGDSGNLAMVPANDGSVDMGRNLAGASPETDSSLIFDRLVLVQKIPWPRQLSKRSREASGWLAELELPEGFNAEPETCWRLTVGESKTWKIYSAASSEPRACLVIQLNVTAASDGGLICRVSGSADDWPHVHLPLSRKWLDPISAQLKAGIATLHLISEQSSAGLPSEVRSALLQQKRLAKERLKYVERLLQMAADCDRLASLLDGECGIKLRMLDAASGAAVPGNSRGDQ